MARVHRDPHLVSLEEPHCLGEETGSDKIQNTGGDDQESLDRAEVATSKHS